MVSSLKRLISISDIMGTKQRISQAIRGKKKIGQVLEGYTKSNISRAEKARIRYRNDRNRFGETTKENRPTF